MPSSIATSKPDATADVVRNQNMRNRTVRNQSNIVNSQPISITARRACRIAALAAAK
jgi:hypothetical protein